MRVPVKALYGIADAISGHHKVNSAAAGSLGGGVVGGLAPADDLEERLGNIAAGAAVGATANPYNIRRVVNSRKDIGTKRRESDLNVTDNITRPLNATRDGAPIERANVTTTFSKHKAEPHIPDEGPYMTFRTSPRSLDEIGERAVARTKRHLDISGVPEGMWGALKTVPGQILDDVKKFAKYRKEFTPIHTEVAINPFERGKGYLSSGKDGVKFSPSDIRDMFRNGLKDLKAHAEKYAEPIYVFGGASESNARLYKKWATKFKLGGYKVLETGDRHVMLVRNDVYDRMGADYWNQHAVRRYGTKGIPE